MAPPGTRPEVGKATERLVERERELAVLREFLSDVGVGAGGVVFIEAPPGGGKTRMLAAAGEIARASGMRILTVAAAELERGLPFALAMRLLEAPSLAADEREHLPQHPFALAAALPDDAGRSGPDERCYSVIRGLFEATEHLAGLRSQDEHAGGLAILVDDLHWADRPSLRFLAYLAERAAKLPIAVVLSATSSVRSADPPAVAFLRRAAAGRVLSLAPLGGRGVERLVRGWCPDADTDFCAACGRVSGGNPFLLTELLTAIAHDGRDRTIALASGVEEIVPDVVRDTIGARLESVPREAAAVAKALAVLGEGASVSRIARLAGLDCEQVLIAADALAATHLIAPGIPLSFAQPILAAAIRHSLPPFERAQAHRLAAQILAEQRAGAELIARHLLEAPAADDPAVVPVLREAAEAALQRSQTDEAIRLLTRALAEHPAQPLRVELLTALARAEAHAGRPHATDRFSEAWRISDDPERRAELALAHGQTLSGQGDYLAAADVLSAGLAELGGVGDLASELRAAFVAAATFVAELRTEALEARDQLVSDEVHRLRPLARAAIAQSVVLDGLQGAPRRGVVELGELAWGDGALLESRDCAPFSVPLLATGLLIVDDLERALEICDVVLGSIHDADLPTAYLSITGARAWALYEQGRLDEAHAAVDTAPDGVRFRSDGHWLSALAVLARCHIEQGRLVEADAVLAALERDQGLDSVRRALMLDIRSQLRLAQHRPHDALKDALDAGAVLSEQLPDPSPGSIAWRSSAALAQLALGDIASARASVREELEQARKIGVTRIVVRDLRILGLALGGKSGLERLAEAVSIGGSYPRRLEYLRAVIDYGAALRRANQRVDAREPLRLGLDLSHRSGAHVLASRARAELIAAGARPRRAALSGIDSLTASQRRVAELAGAGMTTRQVAAALFVTPKTVEFHLRNVYAKLGVTSREELANTLSGSSPATAGSVVSPEKTAGSGARGSDG